MSKKIITEFNITIATIAHTIFAETICQMIEIAAQKRGTGIAKRDPNYIIQKILEEKAIIAMTSDNSEVAGFCYIEVWENKDYVANSGLIVNEKFRNQGLAKKIKKFAFEYTHKKYPNSKLFGITTSAAVMKINSELGYRPVPFSELTKDNDFWNGCQSCPNYDILTRTERKMCLCTGMMYDFKEEKKKKNRDKIYKIVKKKSDKRSLKKVLTV